MKRLIWRLSTQEEMEETMKKISNFVMKYGLTSPAIIFFESIKSITRLVAPFSRFLIAPYFHLIGINTRHIINTLEEPQNIEKLLKLIEEKEEEKKKEERHEYKASKTESKKDWRRFLPI